MVDFTRGLDQWPPGWNTGPNLQLQGRAMVQEAQARQHFVQVTAISVVV
jgi:hypothetical protein